MLVTAERLKEIQENLHEGIRRGELAQCAGLEDLIWLLEEHLEETRRREAAGDNFMPPCPFCGCSSMDTSNETGVYPTKQFGIWWIAACGNPNCGAEVSGNTIAETQERWRRRAFL